MRRIHFSIFALLWLLVGCHLNLSQPQDSESLNVKLQPASIAQLRRMCSGAQPFENQACQNLNTIDQTLRKLNIKREMETDPKIVNEILGEMRLEKFVTKNAKMNIFLRDAQKSPQPLGPLIDAVSFGLTRHPAIMEVLNEALKPERDWLKVDETMVARTLNQMYLFEALTVAVSNDPTFLGEVQAKIHEARKAFGVDQVSTWSTFFHVWRCSGSVFDAIKTISVDPSITVNLYLNANHGMPLTTQQVRSLVAQKKVSFGEEKALMLQANSKLNEDYSGLSLNIYEAAATEYNNMFQDNAFAGHVLVQWLEKTRPTYKVSKGKVFNRFFGDFDQGQKDLYVGLAAENGIYYDESSISQEWVELYESWNMSFVVSQLNDLHILLPKLLIPSVLCAKSGDYVYTRVNALWLAIHQYTMRRMDKKGEFGIAATKRREIASVWGKINREYAKNLVKKSNFDLKDINDSYSEFFKYPTLNLVRRMMSFGSKPSDN